MKFLVDAQLPARLASFLIEAGHDAVHTSALPKDRDFRDGHLLASTPRRLLVVATGNITNAALFALFQDNLDVVVAALEGADFVELGPKALVVHQRRVGDE